MSSTVGFSNILYLGIFIILSPVLDRRIHGKSFVVADLLAEHKDAVRHFNSLLQVFSQRFIIVLAGQPILHWYVVERKLAEFGAAIVVLSKTLSEYKYGSESWKIFEHVSCIIRSHYPSLLPYFVHCVDHSHKDFLWTGPDIQIIQHSPDSDSIMPILTLGELLDLPEHKIYLGTSTMDSFSSSLATAISSPPYSYTPAHSYITISAGEF
jgi:hypothetical protein